MYLPRYLLPEKSVTGRGQPLFTERALYSLNELGKPTPGRDPPFYSALFFCNCIGIYSDCTLYQILLNDKPTKLTVSNATFENRFLMVDAFYLFLYVGHFRRKKSKKNSKSRQYFFFGLVSYYGSCNT